MKKNYASFTSYFKSLALLLALLLPVLAHSQGISPADQARLQAVLEKIVNNPERPFVGGVSAAIKIDNLAMWKGAAGYSSRNVGPYNNLLPGGSPLSTDTLSHIYSVTKTFTAALVIELAQEGLLDLDAPVSRYMPIFAMINPGLNSSVTLRQLMSHQTGYSDYVYSPKFQQAIGFNPSRIWKSFEAIAFASQLFEPGSGYLYSSTNYVILGAIVEAVTRKPVEEHYRTRFLEPLGMKNTYLAAREARGSRGYLASPHDNLSAFNPIFYYLGMPLYPNEVTNISKFPLTAIMSSVHAGGAMVSNVDDMIIWGDALFSGRATSQATLNIMLNSFPQSGDNNGEFYGYGLTKNNKISTTEEFIGHSGRATGYRALLVHQPEKKITIAIASNFTAADVYAIAKALYEALPAYSCGENGGKIQLCFNGKSICVAKEAAPVIIRNGAFLGACQPASTAEASRTLGQAEANVSENISGLSVYPNPFQDQVTLNFTVETAGQASLVIYDLKGKAVATLFEGPAEAGVQQRAQLSSKQLPAPGLYLSKLTTASGIKTKKIMFTR